MFSRSYLLSESLDRLNPFSVLGISRNATPGETKSAFRQNIHSSDRRQRSMTGLAYDMICSRDATKYTRNGDTYTVNVKNVFYYVIIGDYNGFVRNIKKSNSFINQRDEFGRSLLYTAARNGYYDICNFLLRVGCDVNEIQKDGSTPLHAAAFYGHQVIVGLLLEYGANPKIQNNFKATALDEACNEKVKSCIQSRANDQISALMNILTYKGLAKNLVVLKHNGKVIGKKILRNSAYFAGYSKSQLDGWVLAWHGTKFRHLESIMKHGLHSAGTALSSSEYIAPQTGHIALNRRVGSFDNWANAVFVSPSIFYAAHVVYSERIFSDNQQWCVIVEARVRPGSYTQHKHTLLSKEALEGEPDNVEYRIAVKQDEDFIMRVSSNINVIVTALVFVNMNFLDNIDEYCQGDELYANSDAERALFQ